MNPGALGCQILSAPFDGKYFSIIFLYFLMDVVRGVTRVGTLEHLSGLNSINPNKKDSVLPGHQIERGAFSTFFSRGAMNFRYAPA